MERFPVADPSRSTAAGQNTTLFLVRPNKGEPYTELPRHPEELDGIPDECEVCGSDDDSRSVLLECDKVRYHGRL
jgi:hypothetical protein